MRDETVRIPIISIMKKVMEITVAQKEQIKQLEDKSGHREIYPTKMKGVNKYLWNSRN